MDIAAGIASLDAALKIAKGIKGVEKAYDQVTLKGEVVELMGALYDVKGELIDAAQAIKERDAEIERLTAALADKKALILGPGGYSWIDHGDGLRLGYPICPTCLEGQGRQVELKQDGGSASAKCPRCATGFMPVECFLPRSADGKQNTVSEDNREKRAQRDLRRSVGQVGRGGWAY